MTDGRPRPEYGEYATPEEQAAAIGTVPVAMQDITPQAVVAPVVPPQPAVRRWDLILTIALVALGTWVTFGGFAQYSDLQGVLQQTYASYGYSGSFAAPALASAVGIALNIVQPVLLAIAVILSARSLQRGRVSFWIPLTAGVVVGVVTLVLFAVLIGADPGFVDFMTKQMQK